MRVSEAVTSVYWLPIIRGLGRPGPESFLNEGQCWLWKTESGWAYC